MKTQTAVWIMVVLLVAPLLPDVAPSPAFAFYCGGQLLEVGDSMESVMANCGPPTFNEGNIWFYNQGSASFTTKIVFFSGKITAIEEGDYGYGGQTAPSKPSQ